ncbi:hypothetical protein Acr_23g0004010 [Actinidia rufa]|uniref:UBX domain-containing protein n=1 Tax=Actinidia rufa TaxID=165716 RepID=A0A7J0GMG9_9ERIC|nr:hypothetical protein Acr_23g0004010 [Actinidia rufa]
MSSMMRGGGRATGEAFCNGIVRRMVSLPRSLLGGVSRVMHHGIDLIGNRRKYNHHIPSNFPLPYPPQPTIVHDEWAFLTGFEQQYGASHPFFYACRFPEALKMAREEHKFVFLYLHSPDHPFTPAFCRETLGSELVVQFLDANFVCWGAIANMGEGQQMSGTLQPASFPFCAVVAPAYGDNLAVLQQIEGPVSPAELVEILQRTMEEQGLAFGGGRAKEEENRRADRRLREEQDAAYLAALHIDQEKERLVNFPMEERVQNGARASTIVDHEKQKQNTTAKQASKVKEATTSRDTQPKVAASRRNDAQTTQILIRFPSGERREQSFLSTDKVQAIYRYIDSLGLPGIENYRLISSFPRKVYGVDQMGMTLKDAGLHSRGSLFLELL